MFIIFVLCHHICPQLGRSGLTWEIGPVANGVVDGRLLQGNLFLLRRALDFIRAHNRVAMKVKTGKASIQDALMEEGLMEEDVDVTIYRKVGSIPYPSPHAPPTPGTRNHNRPCGEKCEEGGLVLPSVANGFAGFVHPTLQVFGRIQAKWFPSHESLVFKLLSTNKD